MKKTFILIATLMAFGLFAGCQNDSSLDVTVRDVATASNTYTYVYDVSGSAYVPVNFTAESYTITVSNPYGSGTTLATVTVPAETKIVNITPKGTWMGSWVKTDNSNTVTYTFTGNGTYSCTRTGSYYDIYQSKTVFLKKDYSGTTPVTVLFNTYSGKCFVTNSDGSKTKIDIDPSASKFTYNYTDTTTGTTTSTSSTGYTQNLTFERK